MGKGCKNKDQTLLVMYDMYDMYDMYESWVPDLNAWRLFSQFVSPLSKERGVCEIHLWDVYVEQLYIYNLLQMSQTRMVWKK